MPLIELGLVDNDDFNADHVNQIEAAINSSSPAGMVVMTVAAVAPSGWLLLNGQVVPNAQTLYPSLWAAAPVAWRAGAALNLPNMASRFPMGQVGTIAAIGGANTQTLALANLPVHHHAQQGVTADALATHTHGTGNSVGGFVTQQITAGGTNALQITPGTGAFIATQNTTSPATLTHHHDLTGNTADTGSGTALDTTPQFLAVNFMIRSY